MKFVNKTISEANEFLGEKYKPYSDFELFDDVELPSNSDVTMTLGQYLNCFEKFHNDNVGQHNLKWYWKINSRLSDFRTYAPKKLNK